MAGVIIAQQPLALRKKQKTRRPIQNQATGIFIQSG